MSKKPLSNTPAAPGDRVRLTVEFERTQLMGALFGEFDRNLVAIENRLGVYISARGNRVQIEGEAESAARARDVLSTIYDQLSHGQEVDLGLVEGAIAMTAQPTLDGIIRHEATQTSSIVIRTRKKVIAPRTNTQVEYMHALAREDVIFALGPAGTGKTYLAVAQAVAQLITGSVQRLILSRPAVEAGEKLGFLPGDMKEKVDPYLRPLYDALHDMLHADYVERRIAAGEFEIAPLGFMRGRTLARAAVILDEAQNATIAQTKMFLTRLGEGAHMTLTGDPSQSDLPSGEASGLADAVTLLDGVEGVAISRFTAADVVRHPLVGRIIDAYDARDAAKRR